MHRRRVTPARRGILGVVRLLCACVCVCACVGACSDGATDAPALDAKMRVAGAQFVRGAMPPVGTGAGGGPAVASIDLTTNTVWAGEPDKAIAGALAASATAAALALSDDDGYWLVRAGVPGFSAPSLPTFAATASFATTLAPGSYFLQVRAVDAQGTFGPPSTQPLTALGASPAQGYAQGQGQTASGVLVVTLTWDSEADSDLHVVDPSGAEIDHAHPETVAADGGVGGSLDLDSNANCLVDGRREENVSWASAPPSGRYVVRVDAPSLCGQPIAHWTVRAELRGTRLGAASGVSVDSDTWGPHDRGAGLLALQFDVP